MSVHERPSALPTNDDGESLCGRACRDGTPCRAIVALPGIACYQHDRDDPVVL
jgi:hypothetical protein